MNAEQKLFEDLNKAGVIRAAKVASPLDEIGNSAWWQEVNDRINLETGGPVKVAIEPRPGRAKE